MATSSESSSKHKEPIYEAVICRQALEREPETPDRTPKVVPETLDRTPEVEPETLDRTPEVVPETEVEEPTQVLPDHNRVGNFTLPSPIAEEQSEAGSESSKGHSLSQGQSDSPSLPRDRNALDPNSAIGRSMSEPAYVHNGRPVSPWDRQSSSNSQEVEQEYRSLIDGKMS